MIEQQSEETNKRAGVWVLSLTHLTNPINVLVVYDLINCQMGGEKEEAIGWNQDWEPPISMPSS